MSWSKKISSSWKNLRSLLLPGFQGFLGWKASGDVGDINRRVSEEPHQDLMDQAFLLSVFEHVFVDPKILLEQTGNSVDDVSGYYHKAPPYRLVSQTLIDERGVPF